MPVSKTRYTRGIILTPDDIGVESIEGELKVALTAAKFQVYLGGALRNIVTENGTATLTNKTIDANGTGNSISNLEVTDLASGVLNTSGALSGATDAQVPSALAAKTYADSIAASSAAGVQANLTAHINDTTDAHAASAITNTPSGNLSATNQQAANNELQTDIDTRATVVQLDAHINDTTDAHAASAITNTPSGNLAATTVQGALNELQSDINTRAIAPAVSSDNTLPRMDGTNSTQLQQSGVTLSDSDQMAGLAGIVSSGVVNSTGSLIASGSLLEGQSTDNTTTGATATIANPSTPVVRLTNASLVSVASINAAGGTGRVLTVINATGNSITVFNNVGGTAANRILTGTKAPLTLADEASIVLKYDGTEQRWMIIGGSGAGGGASLDSVFQLTGLDVSTWSTGNGTFLTGGTLAGTFVSNTTAPLQGIADYKYTQAAGSLNDYAVSADQAVDVRFRGQQVTLVMPVLYNGLSTDIEWIFYDSTNGAIIPSSVYIPLQTGTSTIFKTNITIPLTCASIRVGFQVRAVNSGKVFEFDSVEMTANTTVMASIQNQTQSSFIALTASTISGATIVGAPSSSSGSGIYSYNSATGIYTALKAASVSASVSLSATGASGSGPTIEKTSGGVIGVISIAQGADTTGRWSSSSAVFDIAAGDTFRAYNAGPGASSLLKVAVSATASNTNIVTAPDTFSTDTNTLTYASSSTYTLATLANAPVGTFITYTYAINSNTSTQTTTAPTQTTASMNSNGIQIFARAYNAASTAGNPSTIAIQIGKGLKGVTQNLYKSVGKVTAGSLDSLILGTTAQNGVIVKEYNEATGVLIVDAGGAYLNTITTHDLIFSDLTSQTSGYLTINASKNPALTGLNISAVAARGVNSSSSSFGNGGATLTFDAIKSYDTHGALNAATGVFTAPEAGFYSVVISVCFNSAAYTAASEVYIDLNANGSSSSVVSNVSAAAYTGFKTGGLSDIVYLPKGGTLSATLYNTRGATSLRNAGALNYMAIAKVSIG